MEPTYVLSPRTTTWFEKVPAEIHGTKPKIGFEADYRGFTFRRREEFVIYDIIPPIGKVIATRYLDGGHTSIEKVQKAIDAYYAENKIEAYENKKLVSQAFCTQEEYEAKLLADRIAREQSTKPKPDFIPDLYNQ